MHLRDFYFDLPAHLIAQYPAPRGSDRLLVLNGDRREDRAFSDLPDLLDEGDLLVFNDTRVMKARLFGRKQSGGQVEVFIERILDQARALAMVRGGKSLVVGSRLLLERDFVAEVCARRDGLFELRFDTTRPVAEILDEIGHIPLPPYIQRPDEVLDQSHYQTVYARHAGAVAAPTAGLHFDEGLLQQLAERGIKSAYVTLHVGIGTFQPVRVVNPAEHRMHSEWMEVSAETAEAVRATRARGKRVVAVGTTSVRALESASGSGQLRPFRGETDIFIYPGYRFCTVDALLTNFHVPESSLLMLVAAFAGREPILAAYQHAVAVGYRFLSYGDAMFLSVRSMG